MSAAELRAEADIEFEHLDRVVDELVSLRRDVGEREPTLRELVAGGAFLTQFYNGVENLLKRISKHEGVPLPEGPDWHVELFRRFCTPSTHGLPVLFDEQTRAEVAQEPRSHTGRFLRFLSRVMGIALPEEVTA